MLTEDEIWEREDFQKAQHIETQIHNAEKMNQETGFGPNIEAMFGICYSCKHFNYVLNDVHQVLKASCTGFNCYVGKNKIKKCTLYIERGKLDLDILFQMATLIDIDKIKNKPGFLIKINNKGE